MDGGDGNVPSNRPRQVDPAVLADLNELVFPNTYVRVDAASDLPESLRPHASGRFKSMVIASSDFVCSSPHTGSGYAPNGPVYLLRNYRYCEHDGSPHFNVDDIAFWTDGSDRQWMASSEDAPDHYRTTVAGTAVSDVWNQYGIPKASSGTVEDFRRQGAYMNFVKPCPGLLDESRGEGSV